MRVGGRQDVVLLGGLVLALVVVFARPVRSLLDLASDVERSSGLALLPALVILTAVLLFHQQSKRQEARARAQAAEADAVQAVARAADMERLVAFGQALGRSLELDAIRDIVQRQLPALAGTETAWVMIRTSTHWQPFVGVSGGREAIERLANRVIADDPLSAAHPSVAPDGAQCLPMIVGGTLVGVLGVPGGHEPFNEARRRTLAAAATLLGISIRNAELFRDVREHSLRDGLTGCFNRSHALDVIDTELRRARRSQMPVSLIMFDIDHFKDVNDRFGHLCGDAVLAAVGARMRDVLRGSDLKCRYGGEEFLVLLPETPLEGAKRVADTMRREIAEMSVPWKDEAISVTASFGVTTALPAEVNTEAIIARADAALYRAKEQGRNCVRLSLESAVA